MIALVAGRHRFGNAICGCDRPIPGIGAALSGPQRSLSRNDAISYLVFQTGAPQMAAPGPGPSLLSPPAPTMAGATNRGE
jgi:hypothetical protein